MTDTTSLFQLKTYDDAVHFLDNLDVNVQKLGLSRIESLLKTLSNPQDHIPTIHVAGTNGKGSTVALLSSILKEAGYKVGSFTSPHLRHVRERLSINGNPILPEDFLQQTRFLKEVLERTTPDKDNWPTYFEFLTALGFQYFKNQAVDIAVIEVGLGGRLDSTNIIKHPNLTVITSIGLDHTKHLGNTLEAIAREKAGILKEDSPLVLGGTIDGTVKTAIAEIAQDKNVQVHQASQEYLQTKDSSLENGLVIEDSQHQLTYQLPLAGKYSLNNLATALKAVEVLRTQQFEISNESLQQGISKTHWPARFEYLPEHRLILDGSHNADGLAALTTDIETYLKDYSLYWLVSLKSGKDEDALINCLTTFSKQTNAVIFTGNPDNHYVDPELLQAKFNQKASDSNIQSVSDINTANAFKKIKALSDDDQNTFTIVTGSLYTAGTILDLLEK